MVSMFRGSFFPRLLPPLLPCLLLVLFQAGCGDREPAQRAAFIAFLEQKVLKESGKNPPSLGNDEKAAIGAYVPHYHVLADFRGDGNPDAGAVLSSTRELLSVKSLRESVDKRDAFAGALTKIRRLKKEMSEKLRKSDAAKAGLKQPADLQTVYDRAYDKVVARPGKAFIAALEKVEAVLTAVADLAAYVYDNRDGLDIVGQQVRVKDAALQPVVTEKLQAVRDSTRHLLAAYEDLLASME
jgi:hypothetical protein